MLFDYFDGFFRNITIPILVYQNKDAEHQYLVYENPNAKMWLNPFYKGDISLSEQKISLAQILSLPEGHFENLQKLIARNKTVSGFVTTLHTYADEQVAVSIFASKLDIEKESYVALYIYSAQGGQLYQSDAQALATALSLAYKSPSTEEAIDNILAFAGNHVSVSRCYIFESISETLSSNTYEWCASGISPSIESLQNLPKEDYSYHSIMENGMSITNDIRSLSMEDQAILEPQGIKSLAVIPFYSSNGPLGYIGFDDCENYRVWSQREIQLLHDLTDIIASLIVRRNVERSLKYSLDILRTVTDNSGNLVYVSNIQTHEIIFVNNNLADSLGTTAEELQGKPCWETIQSGMLSQCSFCPLNYMLNEDGSVMEKTYIWEFKNTITKKWYLVRDEIIRWIDGSEVHIETATEITRQKEHENQLEHMASTDILTGTYTRAWGIKIIRSILESKNSTQHCSIVFIDLDNLKAINDQHGHNAGDQALIKTAEVILSCIRKSDVLCRWGGDEFILILRGNESQAAVPLAKIDKRLKEFNRSKQLPFEISFSHGLTELNHSANQTLEQIIAVADQKMYQEKMKKKKIQL